MRACSKDAVLRLVERCDGDLEQTAVETALNYAARWRRTALADQVLDRATARREGPSWHAAKYVSWAVLAAIARDGEEAQRAALDRGMRPLALGPLDRGTALALLGAIEAFADTDPSWADTLEKFRTAALLAA